MGAAAVIVRFYIYLIFWAMGDGISNLTRIFFYSGKESRYLMPRCNIYDNHCVLGTQ